MNQLNCPWYWYEATIRLEIHEIWSRCNPPQFKRIMHPMRLLPLVAVFLLFPDISRACCCSWGKFCGCNFFGCNCDTVDGWCKKWQGGRLVPYKGGFIRRYKTCESSKGLGGWDEQYCPDRRRRKKSMNFALSQAYSGLYDHLIEHVAMENFLSVDLNRDGMISNQLGRGKGVQR